MSFSYGSSKSSSKPRDITPLEYRDLRGPTRDTLLGLLRGGPEYTGPFAAGLTPDEINRIADVNRMVQNPSAAFTAGRGEVERTLRGDYLNPETNPLLQAYIRSAQRPTIEAYEEARLGDRAAFTRAGHSLPESSPFARARAISDRGLSSALGDIATNIGYGAYEGERGRQSQAVVQATALEKQEIDAQIEALRVSALPRLIEQYGIDKGLELFQQRVQTALAAAGITVGASSQFGQQSKASAQQYSIDLSAPVPIPT